MPCQADPATTSQTVPTTTCSSKDLELLSESPEAFWSFVHNDGACTSSDKAENTAPSSKVDCQTSEERLEEKIHLLRQCFASSPHAAAKLVRHGFDKRPHAIPVELVYQAAEAQASPALAFQLFRQLGLPSKDALQKPSTTQVEQISMWWQTFELGKRLSTTHVTNRLAFAHQASVQQFQAANFSFVLSFCEHVFSDDKQVMQMPDAVHLAIVYSQAVIRRAVESKTEFLRLSGQLQTLRQQFPSSYPLAHNQGLFYMSNDRWKAARHRFLGALKLGLTSWPKYATYGLSQACGQWSVVDWSELADPPKMAEAASQGTSLSIEKTLYPNLESPSGESQPRPRFGHQEHPLFVDQNGAMANVTQISGIIDDVEAILLRLESAWVERFEGHEYVAVHEGCNFHVASGGHVQPIAANIPSPQDLSPSHVQQLSMAYHFHWMHGYYQFVGEIVPKLWLLRTSGMLKAYPNARLLLSPRPYVSAYLAMLGIPERRVLWFTSAGKYHVETLFVPEFRFPQGSDLLPPDRLSYAPSKVLRDMRQLFAPQLALEQRDLVVYVHRKATAEQRAVLNAKPLLRAINGTIATFNTESGQNLRLHVHDDYRNQRPPTVGEQIQTFRRARVLVGAHGGGMTNCLFMGQGSAIIELPLQPAQRSVFTIMASALELAYWHVPELNATQFGHFVVTQDAADRAGQTLRRVLWNQLHQYSGEQNRGIQDQQDSGQMQARNATTDDVFASVNKLDHEEL